MDDITDDIEEKSSALIPAFAMLGLCILFAASALIVTLIFLLKLL